MMQKPNCNECSRCRCIEPTFLYVRPGKVIQVLQKPATPGTLANTARHRRWLKPLLRMRTVLVVISANSAEDFGKR